MMRGAESEAVRLRAVQDVLSRADESTAEQGRLVVRDARALSDEELAAVVAAGGDASADNV